jgi:hypothetical protein
MTLNDPHRGILNTDKLADDTLGVGFWTDLITTDGVYSVDTKRGRQRLLQSTEAGTLTAVIPNPTRRIDPTNLSGPFVSAGLSLVKPMRPARLRADWGFDAVSLPTGNVADYISTPHKSSMAITDLYFEWTGTAKWSNSGTDTLAAKYGTAGNRSWRLRRVNQTLELTWSTNGTATTTESLDFSSLFGTIHNDEVFSFYVLLHCAGTDPSEGLAYTAGRYFVQIVGARSGGGTFTASVVGAASTSIFNATSTPITLGQTNSANPLQGTVRRFALFDRVPVPIDGFSSGGFIVDPIPHRGRYVAVFDATWIPTTVGTGVSTGSSTVTSYPTQEIWTLNGAAVAQVASATPSYDLWRGYVDEWSLAWRDPGDAQTTVTATDGFKILSRVNNVASGSVGAGEYTGARIGRLLDSAGWGSTDRALDTGQTTVQATTLAQNVLTELFLTTDTDRGEFRIETDGTATFHDRFWRYTCDRGKQRAWLFGDSTDGLEIPYSNLDCSNDDDLIINATSIACVGGTAQTSSDSTSQAEYLKRTFNRTDLIHQTDAESASYATLTIAEFKDQDLRFDALTIESSSDDRMWPVILGARIGDRCTVRRRPPGGGSTIERDCFIEGITHHIESPVYWRTTFQLSDASRWGGFVLDDSALGVLDTNRLNF